MSRVTDIAYPRHGNIAEAPCRRGGMLDAVSSVLEGKPLGRHRKSSKKLTPRGLTLPIKDANIVAKWIARQSLCTCSDRSSQSYVSFLDWIKSNSLLMRYGK